MSCVVIAVLSLIARPGDVAACAAPHRAVRLPWPVRPLLSRATRLGARRVRHLDPVADATPWLPPTPAAAAAAERRGSGTTPPASRPAAFEASRCDPCRRSTPAARDSSARRLGHEVRSQLVLPGARRG